MDHLVNKIILVIFLSIALGDLNMEGFYEGQFGRNYESDEFIWNMWDPNLYLETRLHGSPANNSSYYIKFYANKDYELSNQPLAIFSEGNINFSQNFNKYGMSATLFSRESRHYWIDGSMLGIVNTNIVNNDGNGQGVRFDLWHQYNGSMTYVMSDYSQGGGDDIHLLRYRQSLLNKKLNFGIFFQRKQYSTGDFNDYNQVIAQDLKFNIGQYYVMIEIAHSKVPNDSLITTLSKQYRNSNFINSNFAIKSELSGLKIGNSKYGFWYFKPGIFSYGDTYRNYMGDNQSNRYGYWINSYYLVPKRAITISLNYSFYEKLVADTIPVFLDSLYLKEIHDPSTNLSTEIYIEFINGFKGKFVFNKHDENWQGQLYKHYDILSELSVENNLAKLLAQFKVKDVGEIWERHVAGIELSVNLTESWRFFTRGLISNDRVGSRYSIFTELQYRISGNTELYLQYGPSYWGQYGLVNDDAFTSSGSMKKELRFIIKGWF